MKTEELGMVFFFNHLLVVETRQLLANDVVEVVIASITTHIKRLNFDPKVPTRTPI